MSFFKRPHYFFGEFVFSVPASDFPRLASLLAERSLMFWGSEPTEDAVRFSASLFSARSVFKTALEASVPIEISERHGLPFFFSRYKKRFGLFVGLAVGMMLMLISQLFVWKIDIEGNTEVPESVIRASLAEVGISVGSFIPSIDVHEDANRLLMDCRDISSAAISLRGTHLSVAVLERTKIPDIVDTEGYYNVVSTHDGVILDIDAAEGSPEVREGEAVFEGQLLINSFIEGTNGTFRPTHARGIVYAAVKEHFEAEIPLKRITKNLTGRTETKKTYSVLGVKMPSLSGENAPYEYFDSVSSEYTVYLFGLIELPIRVSKTVFIEYEPTAEIIDAARAKLLAEEELSSFFAELDLEVLEYTTSFSADEKNSTCRLTADAVVKRNIAKETVLDIDQIMPRKLPMASE